MIAFAVVRSLVAASAVVVLAGSFSCRPADGVAESGAGSTYLVGVEGMTCQHSCAPKVKSALESIDGVKSAEVSFEEKRAIVKMDQGRELTSEACDESFGNSGYFVSSLAPTPEAPVAEGQ